MRPPALSIEDLGHAYDGREIFSGLSCTVSAGESLALIGASGCGKSTILHILAGLIKAGRGRVVKNPGRLKSSLLLQHYGLFPWKDAWSNVELPLILSGLDKAERRRRVGRVFEDLDLGPLKRRYPAQMSGGQRQRLALGRALVVEPELLLLDEPFSSLDALTRESLQNLLARLWRDKGLTVILATHSLEEAVFLGQRIVVLGGEPTAVAAELANPACGRPEFRTEEKYFQTLTAARRSLEKAGGFREAKP